MLVLLVQVQNLWRFFRFCWFYWFQPLTGLLGEGEENNQTHAELLMKGAFTPIPASSPYAASIKVEARRLTLTFSPVHTGQSLLLHSRCTDEVITLV